MGETLEDSIGGESVKVALRIRPISNTEGERGDAQSTKVLNDKNI